MFIKSSSMTYLTQNKTSMIAGTAILTIALAFGGYSFASHSFEAGVSGDNIPDNTHLTQWSYIATRRCSTSV